MKSKIEFSKKLGDLLDSKFRGPFGFKFGLDGILGLIPIFGDAITTGLSLVIVACAVMSGVGPAVIIRMFVNILIDNLLSKVPVLGLGLDFIWKANQKNLELFNRYHSAPAKTSRVSFSYILFWLLLCLCVLVGLIALSVYLFSLIWK